MQLGLSQFEQYEMRIYFMNVYIHDLQNWADEAWRCCMLLDLFLTDTFLRNIMFVELDPKYEWN
jgi:hypothetical protein